jgi:hypothetical protein
MAEQTSRMKQVVLQSERTKKVIGRRPYFVVVSSQEGREFLSGKLLCPS